MFRLFTYVTGYDSLGDVLAGSVYNEVSHFIGSAFICVGISSPIACDATVSALETYV